MYAETGLMFTYFSQELQQFDEFYCTEKPLSSGIIPSSNFIQASAISDYNLGEEGDLFKAPEPIIQETFMGLLDPMTAAISMISCGEEVMSPQLLSVSDIESSIENGQILSDVFYECRKDILAKDGNETPLSEVLNFESPIPNTDGKLIYVDHEKLFAEGSFQKSCSSSSLGSMDCAGEAPQRPSFIDFPDFGGVYGIRRAFSEGDIKTLGNNGDINFVQSSTRQPRIISSCTSEERKEKLSRYWNKKSKRNFGRKIKYACRKALADNQPRIRGRFARTDEK